VAARDEPARLALSDPPTERRDVHGIILLTAGSQAILAEMYAIGLLASFCINVGCLLIYRWFQGTKEISGVPHVAGGDAAARVRARLLLRLPGAAQALRHRRSGPASSAPS
jgi:hypothetical protein